MTENKLTIKSDCDLSEDLHRLLAGSTILAFTPYVYRCKESDSLTFYWEPDADYNEVVMPGVQVYRSLATKEVIGFRIDGVSRLENA